MADFSRLCIHQVTFNEAWDFRQCVEGMAQHDIHTTAIWREKLEQVGTSEAVRILADNAMSVNALCFGGLLTGVDQDEILDRNRRWLDLAAEIGAQSMVTITGGLDDADIAGARLRAQEALAGLLPHAKSVGVRIALEPLHPMVCGFRSIISTLREVNDWLDELNAGEELGIAFDTYALWWEPNLAAEIGRAGNRIIGFHISDWLAETRDIRLDRGMPGDGLIDIASLHSQVEQAGYSGCTEVEIFSALDWWKRDPDEVIEVIKDRYQKMLQDSGSVR